MYTLSTTLLLLLLATPDTEAAAVQRCTSPEGHITYTHSNCPDSQPWSRHRANNPSSGKQPMARRPAARELPVTIVEDGTRTSHARQQPPASAPAKKKKRSKKTRKSRYLGAGQTLAPKKLKTQKAKSPH